MREPGHIKRAPRVETRFEAVIIDSENQEIAVTISDISKSGFRFSTDGAVRIGDKVSLRLPRLGEFPVQIRWALGTEAGGIFLEPVELRTL